jgi:hypothetical protein
MPTMTNEDIAIYQVGSLFPYPSTFLSISHQGRYLLNFTYLVVAPTYSTIILINPTMTINDVKGNKTRVSQENWNLFFKQYVTP